MMISNMIDYSYFQKSKAFLLPILALPKELPEPIMTYLGIENFKFEETIPLICMYNRENNFDKTLEVLKNNSRYEFDFQIDENFHLVIFDLSHIQKDYDLLINGFYSQLSEEFKTKINLSFPENKLIVLCLDPEKNRRYAEIALELEPGSLNEQEICSPPKMDNTGEILFVKDTGPLIEFYA